MRQGIRLLEAWFLTDLGLADLKPSMTLFSPLAAPMFRTLKLRGRKPGCPGCGNSDTAMKQYLAAETTGPTCGTEEIADDTRISAKGLQEAIQSSKPYILIDTRPEVEYGICALPNSISEPDLTKFHPRS